MSVKFFDPGELKRYSIHTRRHLVTKGQFGRTDFEHNSLCGFLDSLPDILAARDLRAVAASVVAARRAGHLVHMAMGAHVIKVGMSPIIIDLMERGIVTGISFNGAALVHDIEIALIGATSEDVTVSISDGSFGFAVETAQTYHRAAALAAEETRGLGEAAGDLLERTQAPFRHLSVFASAARLGIPATIHCAFGTDIVHMHPEMDPAVLGVATHLDMLRLAALIGGLGGGVWFNIGSAVIMPEVFLKTLSMARNVGSVGDFTAVNMDMQRHYRPSENVLRRPGGRAYNLTGHHEIMLPLLRAAILCEMDRSPND